MKFSFCKATEVPKGLNMTLETFKSLEHNRILDHFIVPKLEILHKTIQVEGGSSQITFTSPRLTLEMLEKLDINQTDNILVIANIETYHLLIFLKKYDYIQCDEIYFLTDIKSISGEKNVIYCDYKDISKLKINMKFDAVIGNPPYHNGKDKHFYIKFIQLSYNLIKSHGKIVFVCPFTWIDVKSSVFIKMTNSGYFNTIEQKDDKEQFGISLGKALCVFVYTKNTSQVGYSDIVILDKYKKSDIVTRLLTKLQKNEIKAKKGKGQNSFSNIQTNQHQYPVYLSSKEDRKLLYSEDMMPGTNISKLICAHILEPKKERQFSEFSISKGVGRYAAYFECTEVESVNIQNYFSSKIYTFINSINRKGRYAYLNIPNIDWSKSWSDAELYAHFNLTQEEIDYIESTIK